MIENIFQSIFHISVWALAKGVVIFTMVLYFAFALVIVRQVYMMTQVISDKLNFLVKILAWVHLLFAAVVVWIAIIIL